MPIGNKLTDRYEIKQTLGQGGMGIVYWAYDTLIRRDVALKTIRDAPEKAALELFYKESNILASMSHPNIIEIFDVGKFEDDGAEKPYFVMPLLKGVTLDSLIRNASGRLTVERTIEILCQTCRGLQAAHECGLVHGDLKPSNIFVLEDDSVKIIDFGVAHMADSFTASAPKGTLLYMAPEQVQLKPATALSDIFTLGVVAYEALTLRRPFDGASHRDIAHAILHSIPPPASDLNPAVTPLIGRVVHKTMAKQPWNRFSTARELADALQKALRNEPIESFDSARVQLRIERATKAFESGDHQFASEILTELESESHLDPAMAPLRRKIDQAVREKSLSHLIESARTRIEENEYPLAMQKLQEALEIDAENAEALRLKQEIESNRGSRQVDEWFRVAHQHLDRFDFSHARSALDNVLEVQPSNTKGRELRTEIQRREEEYLQLGQEKEELYQSAVELYEKHELTPALAKLQRLLELDKRAPETSSERVSSYQSLYNQVRSAQDANMAAYSEARRLLADGNFSRALAICEEALAKHPGQAIFQALKFDIEERKRQNLSAFIADIDRKVYAEPDLDKRVDLLRGAAEQFPEEQYFDHTLKHMKERRDLVNSIVARARRYEEKGQYSEALGQWEILRSVYGQYHGLDGEIERVAKRRAHAAAPSHDAQHDLPVTQVLVDQARDLAAEQKFDAAERLLRQAHQADERNLAIRGLLVETLVQHARSVLDTDEQRAGEIAQSALELDSANLQARGIVALVSDRPRDETVDQSIHRASQLQTAGDVTSALECVEQSLASHPSASRLLQLRTTLQRNLLDTTRAQMRRTDLEKLAQLQMQSETEKDGKVQREILAEVRDLASKYLEDTEFQSALIAMEKRYLALGRAPAATPTADITAVPPVAKPATAKTATPPLPAPPPKEKKATAAEPDTADISKTVVPVSAAETKVLPVAPPPPPPPAAVRPPSVKPLPAKPPVAPPPASRKGLAWVAAAVLLVVCALGAFLFYLRPSSKQAGVAVPAGSVPVEVRTSPEGATILVNDRVAGRSNLRVDLLPGDYRVNAILDGFRPAQTTLKVAAGQNASTDLKLDPLASSVKLVTDFPTATIAFDGHPQGNPQSGQLILDNVSDGSHVLTFGSGASGATIRFDAHAGAPPVVTGLDAANDASAILIANLGSRAHIYTSQKAGSVTVDGKTVGQGDSKGIELNDMAPGDHEITVGDGDNKRKVVYETALAPGVTVYINNAKGQQTTGTLVVSTGEDDVAVSIDGKPRRITTRRGQVRIPNLTPKQYTIAVSKDGFQPVTEQQITVNKGEEARVTFQMRPLPKFAALRLTGAVPGTQVFVDGKLAGAAGLDGGMSAIQIVAGLHRVELRKDDYKTKIYQLTFGPGDNRTLAGADVALEALYGTLAISVVPANAQITIQRAGDAQSRPMTAASARLAVGAYIVTASLAHYVSRSETLEVAGGTTRNVSITLVPERAAAPPKPPVVRLGMAGWQLPWQPDGDHFIRHGGNLCLFRPEGPGTYSFTALMKHGGKLRWVAHATDDKNYAEFELDNDSFTRTLVVNGKAKELIKRKHGISMQPVEATLEISVTPAGITQRIQKLGSWSVLDMWSDPALAKGSFGFLIHGRDEVSLSNFSFTGSE